MWPWPYMIFVNFGTPPPCQSIPKRRVNLQQNIQWPKQAQILRSLCKQGHRPEKSTGGGVKYQLRQVQMGTCFLQEIKNVRPEQMLQSACLKEGRRGSKAIWTMLRWQGFSQTERGFPKLHSYWKAFLWEIFLKQYTRNPLLNWQQTQWWRHVHTTGSTSNLFTSRRAHCTSPHFDAQSAILLAMQIFVL